MKKVLLIGATLLIAACASEPAIQSGPDAETTFDGLVRIDNSEFTNAWIDPEVDLTGYNKIMPGGAQFEFRAVKKGPPYTNVIRDSNKREFYISDEDKQKLEDTVVAAFREEVAKSKHFAIVNEPGPDVLIIVGGLHDIVSRIPPRMMGSGEIYLASLGEATLVLELRDSLSGETLYRAIDRRRIEQTGRPMIESNPVRNWSEVRRWARRWAIRLREGLDSVHE